MTDRFDPLAGLREAEAEYDVFVWGTVFLDIIFSGLERMPSAGTEEWADGMASCPGGIANLAIAARRLGLRTSLAAAFSDDDYGDFCWRTLEEQEVVDLSRSRRFAGWHTPVTVSMSVDRDRSMVTHGHPSPVPATRMIGRPPRSRVVMVDIGEEHHRTDGAATPDGDTAPEGDVVSEGGAAPPPGASWVDLARADGALVFADVGWDSSQSWPLTVLDRLEHCHGFLPNAAEAMAYTRTSTPQDALYVLADRVPLAVVTDGPRGAMAIDSSTGEEAQVPALRVHELDPTGAGDVFGAAMVLGTLARWRLVDRLAFSALCSALALQQFGGSLAAPGWGDIKDWWSHLRASPATDSYTHSLRRRYEFLDDVAARVPAEEYRRATATIARRADVGGPS